MQWIGTLSKRSPKACTIFELKDSWPSAIEILAMIDQEASASSIDLHLKISQATALEYHDHDLAQIAQQHG